MADTDAQTELNKAGDTAVRAARNTADTARKASDAATDTAKAGLRAEQRSFSAATEAQRQMADKGVEAMRTGQDMARKATDQAAEFWRSSLTPMSQMQSEFGRWVEQFWRHAASAKLPGSAPFAGMFMAPFGATPLADLRQTEKGLELRVELPGLKAEDVDLTLRGEFLVLSGEKAEDSALADGSMRLSERRFGRFERMFPLPPMADRARIDASFEDGLLKVSIPLLDAGEPERSIPVRA